MEEEGRELLPLIGQDVPGTAGRENPVVNELSCDIERFDSIYRDDPDQLREAVGNQWEVPVSALRSD